jgi:hypothetical protein
VQLRPAEPHRAMRERGTGGDRRHWVHKVQRPCGSWALIRRSTMRCRACPWPRRRLSRMWPRTGPGCIRRRSPMDARCQKQEHRVSTTPHHTKQTKPLTYGAHVRNISLDTLRVGRVGDGDLLAAHLGRVVRLGDGDEVVVVAVGLAARAGAALLVEEGAGAGVVAAGAGRRGGGGRSSGGNCDGG